MPVHKLVVRLCSPAVLSVLLTLPLAACSSGDEHTEQELDRARICETICDRDYECDSRRDRQVCSNLCGPVRVELERLRGDLLSSVLSCYEGLDCDGVADPDSLSDCILERQALLSPSSTAIRFCDAALTATTNCDGSASFTRASCLNSMKGYSDEVLEKLIACTTKSCNVGPACLTSTLGLDT